MLRLFWLIAVVGLFFLYLAWPTSKGVWPASYEKRVALVIGNSNYVHSPKINSAANNARDISHSLRRLGFDVVEGTNLTQTTIQSLLGQFDKLLKNADIAVLFYSGYVHQEGDQTYIKPVESNPLRLYELGLQTIELRSMLIQMARSAKASLVVFDACRAFLPFQSQDVLNDKCYPLTKIPPRKQMMFSYSAESQIDLSTMQSKSSPFTNSFLRFADREIATAKEMSLFTALSVIQKEVALNTSSKQVPWNDFSSKKDISIKLAYSKPFVDTKYISATSSRLKTKDNKTVINRPDVFSPSSKANQGLNKPSRSTMPQKRSDQTKLTAIDPGDQITDRPVRKVKIEKKHRNRKTVRRKSWQEQKLDQMLDQND